MREILIIAESIDIEDSSASKVNVALILNLVNIEYSVRVLHYTKKDIYLDNIECIAIPEQKFTLNYVLSRAQRVFQRWTKINVSKPLENIFGHSFTFFNDSKSIKKSIKKHYLNEDLIITLSKGASFRPHHSMLQLPQLYPKWMAYVHDPYPFHNYPKPYEWFEAGYQYKERFFKKVSESAKYSAFPSELLKVWMGQYYPNFLNTGCIIPHQYLDATTKESIVLPEYFNANQFTILHAGNLMKQRDPRGLVEGFKMFLQKHQDAKSNVKLMFLGHASYHKTYLDKVCNDNIYWSKGHVDYVTVEALQKQVSVNVILEAKSNISPFLPGKFPNCVKANKPILHLGPKNSETRRILGEKYEYCTEIDGKDEICEIISRLYINWKNKHKKNLNRTDLEFYLSQKYLKETIENSIQWNA